MFLPENFKKNSYRLNEVAGFAGVSTQTIRNYDKNGFIKTVRTAGNQRIVMRDDLIEFLKKEGLLSKTNGDKYDVIYVRVTDPEQEDELDKQVAYIVQNSVSIQNPKVIKDIGSGDDDKRQGIRELIVMACNGQIRSIYITYESQLARSGYEYLKTLFFEHGVSICVNNEKQNKICKEYI